ncbi:histidine kinase 1 isoform X2 [Cryptomeria japonica]|uniref:histidine kinase 1 isoform X2 n=1 Tax=Cryptomeria japonica TaxID=3369 RepID=UPI0027D9FBBA|nr:histidine kinase 1 isoform X2 [Cryptomeria japonica]
MASGTIDLCANELTSFRRPVACQNILCEIRKRVSISRRRVRRQQNNDNNDDISDAEDLGFRKAHCLSSYYSVFVARLAIMVMLAILIGLLTILTWHFTTVYTTKSIKSLAYSLRYELLQRPVSRMYNILNSTVEITMGQVRLSEYLIGRYPPPQNPNKQVQLYEMMKNITWALFASRKALNAITISYSNGRVQAFHRDRKKNETYYIFSEPGNSTFFSNSQESDNIEGKLKAPVCSWPNVSLTGNNLSIWYREPLDPSTGEINGPREEIPPDALINIAGISEICDGDASWHVTVSKFTDMPLLSSASPVRRPTNKSIVAVVGVRTSLLSVGQLMKDLVDLHSGHMYLTSLEGYLLATSTNAPLMVNTTGRPKLMTANESTDPIIRAGAEWLQKKYANGSSFSKEVHVENVLLGQQKYYIDSFILNLTRLPLVGVIIIPRSFVLGEVDRRGHATFVYLISASFCILIIGCVCILILTSGVSKEMKLRAELISHLDARRRAEASSNFKSQFLANMSHELRTPMAAVIGLLDILLCDEYLTTEQISMISQIRRCSTALLRLLNNILDLSKVESGKLILEEAEFDLGRELEGLVDMFFVQCVDHNTELVLDLDDNMPKVIRGDSARVVQIFANLISNSIKFTSSGHIILRGWCEYSTVNKKRDGESENERDSWFSQKLSFGQSERRTSQSQEKITLWFEVDDTGCGIDPSKWESVFESFVQADLSTTRTYGGTGLGLCIVRSLVNKMGGQISVRQKGGPGTLMQLTLVFGAPSENSGQISQQIWKGVDKDHTMVLLALNGDIGRSTMSQWLQANGFQVHQAANWNEMIQALSKIDCIRCSDLHETNRVQSKSMTEYGVPLKECSCTECKEDSISSNDTRVLYGTTGKKPSNAHNFLAVIDSRFLDVDIKIWKGQASYLNKYRGRVKFAWLLNHDTSATVKLELRKSGHSIMVNRPLYKSKLIQILTAMVEDTTYQAEQKGTGSGLSNLPLNSQQRLNIQSTRIPSSEEPSDYFLDEDCHDITQEIGDQFTKENEITKSTCHIIPNIPDSTSAAKSLSGSVKSINDKQNCIPHLLKKTNGLAMTAQTCEEPEGINLQSEMVNSTSKFKVDSVSSQTDTRTFSKSLDTSPTPELDSRIYIEDSSHSMKESKSLMSAFSKHCNGDTFNIQLASEGNNKSQNENLPHELSCIPSGPSLPIMRLAGGPPSLNYEKECLDCIHQPIISEPTPKAPVRWPPSNGTSTEKYLKGIRILLAEDTPVLQRVATIMLEKMGATVVAVGDGLQAVDALKCNYDMGDSDKLNPINKAKVHGNQKTSEDLSPFDLVLMDCQMPKMDGYEATKVIRIAEEGTGRHIPIVALTAHAMSSDEAKCLEVGMDAYLTKPIDSKLMASTIVAFTKRKK